MYRSKRLESEQCVTERLYRSWRLKKQVRKTEKKVPETDTNKERSKRLHI